MSKPPSAVEFIRNLFSHLLSAISGALSVPFAVYGLYVTDTDQKKTFFALSGLSFLFSVFTVWARERNKLIKSEVEIERINRDRPELFMKFQPKVNHFEKDALVLSNHGKSSAVNISISTFHKGNLSIKAGTASELHTTDPPAFVTLIVTEGECEYVDKDLSSIFDHIVKSIPEMNPIVQFHINYKDTNGKMFLTIYDVTFRQMLDTVSTQIVHYGPYFPAPPLGLWKRLLLNLRSGADKVLKVEGEQ